MKKIALFLLLGIILHGCGDLAINTNTFEPEPSGSEDTATTTETTDDESATGTPTPRQQYAAVYGSNFLDPVGSIATVNLNTTLAAITAGSTLPLPQLNVVSPPPGSDAFLKSVNGVLYIINRFGGDNIQVVPAFPNFSTISQFSTGAGTNPQDVFTTNNVKGYVTVLASQNAAGREDLQIVNLFTGDIIKQIDLTPYTTDDGDRHAFPTRMVQVGNELWILIQDLSSGFQATTNGKIAVLDLATDTITDVIQLAGRNPTSIVYHAGLNKVFVSNTGVFVGFTHDLADAHGGIEVINPNTKQTQGIIIADDSFGGFVGTIAIASSTLAYVTVQATSVGSFNPTNNTVVSATAYATPGFYLPEIHYDGKGHLLITERGNGAGSPVGIAILDTANDTVLTTVETGPPPGSMTVVSLPVTE
jgi:hypothetical protein